MSCLKKINVAVFMKALGVLVLFASCLLLVKGFSYAVPLTSPIGSNIKRSLQDRNFSCGNALQSYHVAVDCRPCSGHELKFIDVCKVSGNVEEVVCNGTNHFLPCPFAFAYEEKKFWIFQVCVLGVSLVSNSMVWWRRRAMDLFVYQRLKRQISDGGV